MTTIFSKDGTRIDYRSEGKGTPLILIDGALCSTQMGPMSKLISLLSDNFKVLIYDRRGRNQSGNTAPYSIGKEIEDLEALIKEAGGNASLFGISSGASLALAAAQDGLSISKLAIYEPPIYNNEILAAGEKLTGLVNTKQYHAAVKHFLKDMVGLPGIFTFIMQLLPIWSKLKAMAHTLPYDVAIMAETESIIRKSNSVKIPTWIGVGEKSSALFHKTTKELAGIIPSNEYKILKGENHNVSVKQLAPYLIEFFKK